MAVLSEVGGVWNNEYPLYSREDDNYGCPQCMSMCGGSNSHTSTAGSGNLKHPTGADGNLS